MKSIISPEISLFLALCFFLFFSHLRENWFEKDVFIEYQIQWNSTIIIIIRKKNRKNTNKNKNRKEHKGKNKNTIKMLEIVESSFDFLSQIFLQIELNHELFVNRKRNSSVKQAFQEFLTQFGIRTVVGLSFGHQFSLEHFSSSREFWSDCGISDRCYDYELSLVVICSTCCKVSSSDYNSTQ